MPTVACMPRRHALAVVPLIVLVAALVGCSGETRIPPPEPSSAVEPLFASDEDALEAATAAYEEFLLVSGEILRDGGRNPERLVPLVSDEVYASEAEGFALLADNDWRAIGESVLIGTELQQYTSGPPGFAEVIAYVCVSVEGNDIVDSEGVSQVSADRAPEVSFEIVFASMPSGSLLIERKTTWAETAACSAR